MWDLGVWGEQVFPWSCLMLARAYSLAPGDGHDQHPVGMAWHAVMQGAVVVHAHTSSSPQTASPV